MSNKLEEAAAELIQEIKRHPAIVSEQQYNEWYKRILEIAHQPPAESGKYPSVNTSRRKHDLKLMDQGKPAESGSGDEFISDEEEIRQIEKQNRYNAGFVEACKIAGKEIESLKSQLQSEREKNARVVTFLKWQKENWDRIMNQSEYGIIAIEGIENKILECTTLQQSGSSMQPEGGEKQKPTI